jgi:hypothetical protein
MKPYGYVRKDGEGLFIYGEHQFENAMGAELVPVYLHPKEWVGLTDEQIFSCENSVPDEIVSDRDWCIYFARAIEAKLKEKM